MPPHLPTARFQEGAQIGRRASSRTSAEALALQCVQKAEHERSIEHDAADARMEVVEVTREVSAWFY
jgi:hypothetical protein